MSVPTLQRDKASGIIYMHWTDPSPVKGKPGRSRRRTTGTSDMDAAKAFLGRFLLLEQSQPANGGDPLVADLWAIYAEKHIKRNVMATDTLEWSWKNLSQHFGSLTVSGVSQDAVDAYQDKRASGAIGRPSGQSTVRRELNALRACLNWCADPKRRIIDRDKLPAFDLPSDSEPRDRWLRTAEIQRLMAAARAVSDRMGNRMGRGERFLWLALETGARSEAIRQLTWDRVDWETKTIDFNVPGRRQTKKRRVVVPISANLREPLLRMYSERLLDGGLVLDSEAPVWKLVKRIADNAKVADVSPHVLRHTAATHMARRGVPLWTVAKVLGNTLAMVERVYAKHAPEDLRTAIDSITGTYIGSADAPAPKSGASPQTE